jgi:hypothetical protein
MVQTSQGHCLSLDQQQAQTNKSPPIKDPPTNISTIKTLKNKQRHTAPTNTRRDKTEHSKSQPKIRKPN